MVDLQLAHAHQGDVDERELRAAGGALEAAGPVAVVHGAEGVGELRGGGEEALPERGGLGGGELGDVGVAPLGGGVHRLRLAQVRPVQHTGQALRVEGEVGHHVPAGPAREEGVAGVVRVGEAVHGAYERLVGAGDLVGRGTRQVGHGPIVPPPPGPPARVDDGPAVGAA